MEQDLRSSKEGKIILPALSTDDLGRYPILDKAGERFRDTKLSWEDLGRPELQYIIDRAAERITIGTRGQVHIKPAAADVDIITFVVALVMVKAAGMDLATRKFALAEARRIETFLESDLKNKPDGQRQALFKAIFGDLLHVNIEELENGLYALRVPDYLKRAVKFNEPEWKLVNQAVDRGFVFLELEQAVRLIRHEVATLIRTRIQEMRIALDVLPEPVRRKVQELKITLAPTASPYSYSNDANRPLPPCIEHCIKTLESGENLADSGRVLLALYMINRGKSVDQVVDLFRNAPDFNEKITRYHVERFAAKKEQEQGYSSPGCQWIAARNLCHSTEDCSGIVHPMQFRKRQS